MADYIQVELPELYPWVMLTAGTISFQCILIGFGAGSKRKKIYPHAVLNEKFGE